MGQFDEKNDEDGKINDEKFRIINVNTGQKATAYVEDRLGDFWVKKEEKNPLGGLGHIVFFYKKSEGWVRDAEKKPLFKVGDKVMVKSGSEIYRFLGPGFQGYVNMDCGDGLVGEIVEETSNNYFLIKCDGPLPVRVEVEQDDLILVHRKKSGSVK